MQCLRVARDEPRFELWSLLCLWMIALGIDQKDRFGGADFFF